MIGADRLQQAAQAALDAMRAAGFAHAQVSASCMDLDELNANDNQPTLMRSTETTKLSLAGIVDGRMASTELDALEGPAVSARINALLGDARAAPQDEAHAVSAGQRAHILQGPQEADLPALAAALAELLAFRASQTPRMVLRNGICSHRLRRWHTLTSGGSDIAGSVGSYELGVAGSAREGERTSSLAYSFGATDHLPASGTPELFGMGQLMRECERQIVTQPIGGKFVGDVVFTPAAVSSLLVWLLGQLGDTQLIAGSSLYRDQVGQAIAATALTLRSRFDGPGQAPVSADAFLTPPLTLVEAGVLRHLIPTLYGSRKTGLPHVPASNGWEIDAGGTPLSDLVGGVPRGALVGRLSMGMPAANGNFSAVIKNSFAIEGGELGPALAETMITGNMAQLLRDIVGVSQERLEGEGWRLPWLRMANLHFS